MKTLKEKLVEIRKSAKLSRAKLSKISGFNARTIESYENTKTPPSDEYVRFCSLYFGYRISTIKHDYYTIEAMSPAEQTIKIYGAMSGYSNYKLHRLINFLDYKNADDLIEDKSFEDLLDFSFKEKTEQELNESIEHCNINKDEFCAEKYAEFIKNKNIKRQKGLENSLDLEILELLYNVNDDIKKSIITLLKAQQNQNKRG